jgi:hypothetical protein
MMIPLLLDLALLVTSLDAGAGISGERKPRARSRGR